MNYYLTNSKKIRIISILILTFSFSLQSFAQSGSTDLFPVSVKQKWGYINSKGKLIIETKYELALPFSDGYALVKENGELAIINTKEEKVLISKNHYYLNEYATENMLAYQCNDGSNFYNFKDEKYLVPKYSFVKPYSNGLAAFKDRHSSLYGFINKKGEIEIQAQFSSCGAFSEDRCRVKFDGKWAYIDLDGRLTCLNSYTYISDYSEGLAGVWKFSNTVQYINLENEVIFSHQIFKDVNNIPAQFSMPIYQFSEGLVKVIDYISGLYGYKDEEGNQEIRYQYKEAGNFSEGLACVKYGKKWGYINKKGKLTIQAEYDFANNFRSGLAAVYKGGNAKDFKENKEGISMAYINKKGKIIWEFSR